MPKTKFQEVYFYDYHGVLYGLCHDLLQHSS